MSTKKIRLLIISIIVVLSAAGCQCSDNQIDIMEVILDSPAGDVVSSLLPTFNWHNSEDCQPDYYHLYIKENTEIGGGLNFNTPDDSTSYTISGTPLEPGKEYAWIVEAREEEYGASDWSEPSLFYTGPVCTGETLIAPDLQDPNPAAWVEHEYTFNWTYNGGCLPISYEVQFARDAAFTDIYLTAVTSDPHAQHLLMAFPDCSSLFWRVRAFDGTSYGPWSDSRDFHYIISDGCYQWNYLSDDFAWINVWLNEDNCHQTGYIAAWTPAPLDYGCMVDGMIIVGDGTTINHSMHDFIVDLGAGPCPSTGLDQKTANSHAKFGVLTPGTYCVTVSRDQTVDNHDPVSLMDGIWTDPRSNQLLVEETVTFGPGVGDHIIRFVWDEIDRPLLTFPLDKVKKCYFGPEPHCPVVEFTDAGAAVPILGRDKITEWLLAEVNGTPCYLQLEPVLLEQYENENGISIADLEIFPEPDPCPKPETKPGPDPASKPTCSDYTTRELCSAHASDGCKWNHNANTCDGP